MKRAALFFIVSLFLLCASNSVLACDSCTVAKLGRNEASLISENKESKWFFKYLFENQTWKDIPASTAHALHHDGHHVHDKTTEQYHHYVLGNRVSENFTYSFEFPYVVRNSIEIDSHSRLGQHESSEGTGDLKLIGNYRFLHKTSGALHAIGGVKLPTGETDERNSVGEKFEPEMQPGTGSVDYISGLAYNREFKRISLSGNAVYVAKTEGEQGYEFGDLFSTCIAFDYLLNPNAKYGKTRLGIETNFQHEQKHVDHGAKVADSGGNTFLWGPSLSVEANSNMSFSTSFLSPAYQDLGGLHQSLDYAWTLEGKVVW